VYLMTAVATRGATASQGKTSTNALVDVVAFFSEHVYADLNAGAGEVHPILQVDAIRFLYSFRNQVCIFDFFRFLSPLLLHFFPPVPHDSFPRAPDGNANGLSLPP